MSGQCQEHERESENLKEREQDKRGREDGRKNKMREIEWRVQKTGLESMWAIATPQSPRILLRLLSTPRPLLTLSLRYAVTPPPVMRQEKQGE